jgi:hypothetical protein
MQLGKVPVFAAFDSEKNVWGIGNTLFECFLNSAKVIAEQGEEPQSLEFAEVEEPTSFLFFLSMIGNIYAFWHLTDLRWEVIDNKIRILEVENKGLEENE